MKNPTKTLAAMVFAMVSLAAFVITGTFAVAQVHRDASLAQQKMCSEQAQKQVREDFPSDTVFQNELTSHYDVRTNVCYMLVHSVERNFQSYADRVFDAFEGREYAYFQSTRHSVPIDKPDFVLACYVKPLDQGRINCKTSDDFEQLVEKHFGIRR